MPETAKHVLFWGDELLCTRGRSACTAAEGRVGLAHGASGVVGVKLWLRRGVVQVPEVDRRVARGVAFHESAQATQVVPRQAF